MSYFPGTAFPYNTSIPRSLGLAPGDLSLCYNMDNDGEMEFDHEKTAILDDADLLSLFDRFNGDGSR